MHDVPTVESAPYLYTDGPAIRLNCTRGPSTLRVPQPAHSAVPIACPVYGPTALLAPLRLGSRS